MARLSLTDAQWAEIRRSWEYDPGEPTYRAAAQKAGGKFGFEVPAKSTVESRAKREGWARRADQTGINAAAQRKADKLTVSDGSDAPSDAGSDGVQTKKGASASDGAKAKPDLEATQSGRDEAEDLRAKVIARHRKEWEQIASLRQQALAKRPKTDPATGNPLPNATGSIADAFEAMKLTKITAEATHIQQAGERKAWGLDVVINPEDLQHLSDEDLQLIAAGKSPKR